MQNAFEHVNFNTSDKNLVFYCFKCCPNFINGAFCHERSVFISVSPNFIAKFLLFVKKHFLFKHLIDAVASDFPSKLKRFNVFYIVRKFKPKRVISTDCYEQILVLTHVDEFEFISSVSTVYSACFWLEREIFDLFGVCFSEHNDLRRILTDYGFSGFPLRKDFPLSGFTETRFDDSYQRVVNEPVELTQEFRTFDFLNPWVK
jgi:NADH:ubiquinone oxidoreductase subunit C